MDGPMSDFGILGDRMHLVYQMYHANRYGITEDGRDERTYKWVIHAKLRYDLLTRCQNIRWGTREKSIYIQPLKNSILCL